MGIVPIKVLPPKFKEVSAERKPISDGIEPARQFSFRLKYDRCLRLPIAVGIVPVKLLMSSLK